MGRYPPIAPRLGLGGVGDSLGLGALALVGAMTTRMVLALVALFGFVGLVALALAIGVSRGAMRMGYSKPSRFTRNG